MKGFHKPTVFTVLVIVAVGLIAWHLIGRRNAKSSS